jgi:thioredoxin:protein disulfide reductase
MRLLIVLILGVLLSLTPCIYPMIPITVGILQANQTASSVRNFLVALAYTLGISTTFAIFGFLAALGSCIFGELQGSPWVVIPLVLLLGYLGFAMLGFYEPYIPRFMQPKASTVKGGSFLSAFIFGIISGTVASPCTSPGLTLILTWIGSLSKSGSFTAYAEGFILLFAFGIGSSLPLLIIGTFSGSINLLPQAGMWMVEVKKLLGLMLIATCFYYLSYLEKYIPWYILIWVIVLCLVAFGIYYFLSITPHDSRGIKRFRNIMGTLLIVTACGMAIQGYKAVYDHFHPTAQPSPWLHDYTQAKQQAQQEHKRLFIDIGASYCGACKVLDKTIFKDEKIIAALSAYVPVKIEQDTHEKAYEEVKALFGPYIQKTGFPTFLIVNPATNEILKHWGADINELTIQAIVDQLILYSR